MFLPGQQGRLDGAGLNDSKHLPADGLVDRGSAEADALGVADVQMPSMAGVSQCIVSASRIDHRQLPAASSASQQAGQQSRPLLGCSRGGQTGRE
jgi:hypothetical protein